MSHQNNFDYNDFQAAFTMYQTDMPECHATAPDPVITDMVPLPDAACKGDTPQVALPESNDVAMPKLELHKQVNFSEIVQQAQAIQVKVLTKAH